MKRSRLKLPKKGKEPPDLRQQQTMEYSEAVRKDIWKVERGAADAILSHCRKLKLPMKLDTLTQGLGNCFMVAVLQQLRRQEIHNNLGDDLKQMAVDLDQMKLRRIVVEFIRHRKDHPQVMYMKERFAPDLEVVNGPRSWEEYWERMLINCNWADGDFVQATAWYFNRKIWIMDTSCTRQLPYIEICGNMDDTDSSLTNVDPLLIGSTTGNHYQSLLFDWEKINVHNSESNHTAVIQHLKRKHEPTQELNEPPCKVKKDDFKTSSLSDSKCPNCKKEFKQLLKHLNKSKCHPFIEPELIQQLKASSDEKTRLKKQIKSAEFRKRKRTEDHVAMKKKHNQTVAAYRENKRIEKHEEMKRKHNETVAAYRERKRMEDHDELKKKNKETVAAHRERKRMEDHDELNKKNKETVAAHRERKRMQDHETMKLQQKGWNKTMRKVENEEHRLKAFR